ncbi:MAG: NADH-quinone oxidoreductase subunit C [Chloroflexi bacterium]|nr:NADH-quinone oxidoreductase subunit C [Chloroflexota bacterium]MYF81681.1 NADH-quinone oxidoreductase subunit C [Chloroflexota bacterium]MYI05582.1 NADH-quinone oxidoreductase subunit C [Chloroflexota bacterium]
MTAQYDATAAMEIVNASAPGAACIDEGVLYLEPDTLAESIRTLRDSEESDLVFLSNLTAVDHELHFELVYHLQSLDLNHILQVKARIFDREDPALPSLTRVYHGAHLQEREVYDLFGIRFDGHPDLRRMFLWEGFPGYPLRKDFLQMPGQVRAGLPGFPHESEENAWPVPGSVPQRPLHPNDPQPEGEVVVADESEDAS